MINDWMQAEAAVTAGPVGDWRKQGMARLLFDNVHELMIARARIETRINQDLAWLVRYCELLDALRLAEIEGDISGIASAYLAILANK